MKLKGLFISIGILVIVSILYILGWFYLAFVYYKVEFIPDSLPIAHINQPYKQIVTIEGGRPINSSTATSISNNNGLRIDNVMIEEIQNINNVGKTQSEQQKIWTVDPNRFIITGVPTKAGVIEIRFSGLFQGGGNKKFDKTYHLVVKE